MEVWAGVFIISFYRHVCSGLDGMLSLVAGFPYFFFSLIGFFLSGMVKKNVQSHLFSVRSWQFPVVVSYKNCKKLHMSVNRQFQIGPFSIE